MKIAECPFSDLNRGHTAHETHADVSINISQGSQFTTPEPSCIWYMVVNTCIVPSIQPVNCEFSLV
jgi:hypothetical protein